MIGTEEYDDPVRYDAEYGSIDEDGAFFLSLAESCGSRMLDLGCGTGRLAIPLARRGNEVTGIDRSRAMLTYAERKAEHVAIRWVEGDFRNFDLGQEFDLIIACGHAFQALLTEADQQTFLRCVRRHLAAGGRLAFDTRNTVPLHLGVTAQERLWHSFVLPDGSVMDESGLREERLFGDFSGGPVTDASPEIVVVAVRDQAGQSEAAA